MATPLNFVILSLAKYTLLFHSSICRALYASQIVSRETYVIRDDGHWHLNRCGSANLRALTTAGNLVIYTEALVISLVI